MELKLRDYQQECIDAIQEQAPGAYLCQMATGLGKTATFSHIPRNGRVLLLSHREELVHQPARYYDCAVGFERAHETSHGEPVVSASVQSLVRRLNRFSPDEFNMIITDECFPGNVKVDGKPLKKMERGDIIASWNSASDTIENRRITHVFKRIPSKMCVVSLENGQSIPCTPNHPFYVEGVGYVPAINLSEGVYVRKIHMHTLRETNRPGAFYEEPVESKNGFLQKNWKNILFFELLKRIFKTRIERYNVKDKSKVCQRKDETQKSDEGSRTEEENVKKIARDWALSENSVRQWSGADSTAANIASGVARFGTICGICYTYEMREKIRNAISKLLQNRYSHSRSDACDRGGREKPFCIGKAYSGQKERILFDIIRVASVEVREPTSDGTFGGLCPDGYVYNLEVDGNHNYFADGILVHNCHHAAADTYRTIYDYFRPRLHIGFTATPNRGDNVRLDNVFSKIIFQRDLRWGIENGYLCPIKCLRVDIGYNLTQVKTRMGDYAPGELEEAMEGTADAIAQAYKELAQGATLIFAVSVKQAQEIAQRIPGAVVVTGKTPNRDEIIKKFTSGDIKCIVNVMVFTEGTDIPRVETVIVARPTQSESLYAQMVGRGLRLYPGKKELTLIDCVGITGKASLCTAPSLLGIDLDNVPEKKRAELQGDLFELPDKVVAASDCPESWIKNVQIVDLWAREQKFQTHDVNWFRMPDGSFVCSLLDRQKLRISCPDALGNAIYNGTQMPMQDALDAAYIDLRQNFAESAYIWDLRAAKKWGKAPASDKQKQIIARRCKGFDVNGLTKMEASQILNRVFAG